MKVKFAGKWFEVAEVQEDFGIKLYGIYDEPETNPEHIDWIINIEEVKEEEIIMDYHNEDIAACTNDNCSYRLTCLRWWLGTNKDPYQTYISKGCKDKEFYVNTEDYGLQEKVHRSPKKGKERT